MPNCPTCGAPLGQAGLLTVHDIACLMGTGVMAVYQRAHRDPDFPRQVCARHWARDEIVEYLRARPGVKRRAGV